MILYFDNLIIDEPWQKGHYLDFEDIRDSKTPYKMPSKINIALYSLISYAEISWTDVVIKYEINNDPLAKKRKYFEREVKKLFPKKRLHLIYGRGDCQEKFLESLKLINSLEDEWVFYTGNVDHPFIAPSKKILALCINELKKLKKKQERNFLSIYPSHFTEFLNASKPLNPVHELSRPNSKVLKETDSFLISSFPGGIFDSIQIMHKDLLNHLFSSEKMRGVIRRSEEVAKFVEIKNQVVISPKKEIMAHFDGYSHTKKYGYFIPSDLVPPLFIPPGFFEKKIKIAYGYDDYREGWVNINPSSRFYSFRNKKDGTDLMITLDEVPLFWKKRISKIDINPQADLEKLRLTREQKLQLIKNPWKSKGRIFYYFYRKRIWLRTKMRWSIKRVPRIFLKPYLFLLNIIVDDYSILKKGTYVKKIKGYEN
ncbi:MAG TPA: hypothetical protein VJZ93_00675 [Candidatus Nanoarchaeia archaeon]|nr:hypothetical protein [Candidatus Nanoarchaeia archaeon]